MGVDIGAQRRFWRDEQERKPGSCAPEGEDERADAFELNAASCAVLRCVCLRVHAVIIPGTGISDSGVRARSALDRGLGNGGGGMWVKKGVALGATPYAIAGCPHARGLGKRRGEEKGLGYVGEDRLEAEEALQAGVTCLQACYIAAADVARCDCSTDGEAFDIHGVVNAAEELSGCIAYGEEALNRLEVFVEALVVLVDDEASEDCGKLFEPRGMA